MLILTCLKATLCRGVTSKVTRHSSSQDFLKGEANDVIIGSRGTIQLSRLAEVLVKQFDDVWSINAIVVSGDTVYMGTSPNGGIYSYGPGGLKKIYSAQITKDKKPASTKDEKKPEKGRESPDANEPNDANTPQPEIHLANEHIFAMATDNSGRLLAGISGQRCVLCRLEGDQMKVIFEPNDANYIFAIMVEKGGDIYLATGPQGKIYRVDSQGKRGELIFDSPDKNILSLAQGPEGLIYAGSDTRGLVYKVNPRVKDARVLYDSDQQEITALLLSGDALYAAATSAQMIQAEARFAAQPPAKGRPETKSEEPPPGGDSSGGTKLQIANTKEPAGEKPPEPKGPPTRPPKPSQASSIYKITKDGFVTDIFNETAVFFCMAESRKEILVGTGNDAQLFSVEPNTEENSIIYQDRTSSQITAVVVSGDDIYVGLANPARLAKLGKALAREGTFTSDLVDAGQPAKWGKLQIEAEIPKDCLVLVASRSGNVKDINDPSFSKWSKLEEVTGAIPLDCPTGRFCQYKLVLRGKTGKVSPVVREVAVADTVPNLAPRVESVTVSRIEAPGKNGVFKIGIDAKDENADKLLYKIDFRKAGRTGWIEIKKDLESNSFEWDSRTAEDGRYEIRVSASDERSNTAETKLTASRISEMATVDNTGPVIEREKIEREGKNITLKMTVKDELSVIGKVDYTIDSDANWLGVIPDDHVFDTTSEDFTIVTEKLSPGQHVIALRLADDVDNTTYKTFDFIIEEK